LQPAYCIQGWRWSTATGLGLDGLELELQSEAPGCAQWAGRGIMTTGTSIILMGITMSIITMIVITTITIGAVTMMIGM
jgi:hypothetical protein